MLTTISEDILDQISGITGVKSVGTWAGDVQDLLKAPQNLPGVYLIYQGAQISAPVAMGANAADLKTRWMVVVVTVSLKSPSQAAETAWNIIEDVRLALIGHQVSTYNKLWPEDEELLFAENGIMVYGLTYTLEARI